MKELYTFTVFTPTFNRASSLPMVFASLKAQTFQDFEWLIVDDGSTDATEFLVRQWQDDSPFPIRYFRQNNGGKHRAMNHGAREAKGMLFLTLDSDDCCLPCALQRLWIHWQGIPESKRSGFSAVTALCGDSQGRVIGDSFPKDIFDSDTISCRDRYGIQGDKWGFQRTDVLREFPFPEIPGERYIAQSVVWNRIARKYQTRFINEILKTVEYRKDGLSTSSARLRVRNPIGAKLYYAEHLQVAATPRAKMKAAINYIRFSLHGHMSLREIITGAGAPCYVLGCFVVGILAYCHDRIQLRNRP